MSHPLLPPSVPEHAATPPHIAEVAPTQPMLAVGGPVYDPPYETPLEDEFAWHLVKYLKPEVRLQYQMKVPTPGGIFWVDFVLQYRGFRIALECGRLDATATRRDALHAETPEASPDHRAALIMGSGAFDVHYHLRGNDLFHHMEDVLYLLAEAHPDLFTDRAHLNLERLATRTAHQVGIPAVGRWLTVAYTAGDAAEPRAMRIGRMLRSQPGDWCHAYDVALSTYATAPAMAQSA